jgi:hypothetical protein
MVVSAVEESGKSHGKGEKPRTAKDNITRAQKSIVLDGTTRSVRVDRFASDLGEEDIWTRYRK